jgi:hypothetical protein
MNVLGMATLMAHWEVRRRASLAAADSATRNGRPALHHLRDSSRCEARIAKLVRLTQRASQPRGAA